MKRLIILLFSAVLILAGCQEQKITPTKGTGKAEAVEAVYPVLLKELKAFDSLYVHAKIELKKTNPVQGMVDLLNGDTQVLISTRFFDQKEKDFIKNQKLDVKTFKFVYNAVAVIGSKDNPAAQLRVDEIRDALLGKTRKLSFIIPGSTTGTYQYLKDDVLDGKDPVNAETVISDSAVMADVIKSPDKLGILSFNTVQDSSKIKFIKIGQLKTSIDSVSSSGMQIEYFTPHPGFVLKDYYPMRQTVYIYLREKILGPASGFTTYLTSYEGQKIALQQNLAPAAVPVKINDYQ